MARADELDELKTRYKALLEKGEAEAITDPISGNTFLQPMDCAALAILIVGARLARILVDLGVIMSIMVREQRWLRMMTQGELEKAMAEQDVNRHKPRIYIPGQIEKLL